jgi:hypothetical protein
MTGWRHPVPQRPQYRDKREPDATPDFVSACVTDKQAGGEAWRKLEDNRNH